MKKLIITANGFGIDDAVNHAVFEGYKAKTITSTTIIANGESFTNAAKIAKQLANIDIGVSLNITEGKSLICKTQSALTASDGYFDKTYPKLLWMSGNQQVLEQIEAEFKAQIEKVINSGIKPVFLASHQQIHSIPKIFDIVCRLAKQYEIPHVRTQNELPYVTPGAIRHFSAQYLLGVFKNLCLNITTAVNNVTLKRYELNTNKNFIGVLYSGQMDIETVLFGINALDEDGVAEISLNPTTNKWKHAGYIEYKTLVHPDLLVRITELGGELTIRSEIKPREEIRQISSKPQETESETKGEGKVYSLIDKNYSTQIHTETVESVMAEETKKEERNSNEMEDE